VNAVADKLREAKALVAKGWTRGDWAKDAQGEPVFEREPEAVCWCASGALFAASEAGFASAGVLHDVFSQANEIETISVWNDAPERTQSEVLAAFDKAIELAEAGQ
jgi:hypothetical protein